MIFFFTFTTSFRLSPSHLPIPPAQIFLDDNENDFTMRLSLVFHDVARGSKPQGTPKGGFVPRHPPGHSTDSQTSETRKVTLAGL